MMRALSRVRTDLLFALFLSLRLIAGEAVAAERDAGLVRIEATEVVEAPFGHIVLLKARNKAIPIFVDAVVAQSIHGALTGEKYPRPLSHDLMHAILQGFNGRVSRVVISLKGATYYADLTVIVNGTSKVFDSRSSDAIALAIHFNAPVLVSERLLEEAGKSLDQPVAPRPGERRL
jgi:uncharacterized protein